MRTAYGSSLVQLMLVLAIIAMLSVIGVPSMLKQFERSQSRQAAHQILHALTLARQSALSEGRETQLCGIVIGNNPDGKSYPCLSDQFTTLAIFQDLNKNRQLDLSSEIVHLNSLNTENATVHLRASFGRPYFRFKSDGGSLEAGNIVYCPIEDSSNREQLIQVIKVNYAGRAYLERNREIQKTAKACRE